MFGVTHISSIWVMKGRRPHYGPMPERRSTPTRFISIRLVRESWSLNG